MIRLNPWKEALSSDNGQYDLVKTENSIRFSDTADDYAVNKEEVEGHLASRTLRIIIWQNSTLLIVYQFTLIRPR